jgi:hypothetical protein
MEAVHTSETTVYFYEITMFIKSDTDQMCQLTPTRQQH